MIATLQDLVSAVESSNNPKIWRFEPNYKPSQSGLSNIKKYYKGLSNATYNIVLASSWGLYQIMGDNLYNMGLQVSIMDYLDDVNLQGEYYKKYVTSRNIDYSLAEIISNPASRDNFSLRYNGSIGYGVVLVDTYNRLKS